MKILNSKKTFIIAEIGNNHEGSFILAKKLIKKAAKCGVDAVKFQTFKTEDYVSNLEKKKFDRLKKFELTENNFIKLSKIAKTYGLKFISTPFDLKSAIFLNNIVDCFKISSGDNNYIQLIDKVLSFNKPTFISTGLLTEKEIIKLKDYIFKKFIKEKVWFLHCVSSYPVDPIDANLNFIKKMKKFVGKNIGYSDHTTGFIAPLLAICFGAKIIEKHFTLDNNFSNFRDHKLSLNPNDMKKMVSEIRNAEKMIQENNQKISKSEALNLQIMRRGIYSKVDKKINEKLYIEDLKFVRPKKNLSSNQFKIIIGKKIKKKIKKDQPIKKSNF